MSAYLDACRNDGGRRLLDSIRDLTLLRDMATQKVQFTFRPTPQSPDQVSHVYLRFNVSPDGLVWQVFCPDFQSGRPVLLACLTMARATMADPSVDHRCLKMYLQYMLGHPEESVLRLTIKNGTQVVMRPNERGGWAPLYIE